MAIKPGQIIDSFLVDGKKVVLRYPKLSDCQKLQKFINQAIRESLNLGGNLGRTGFVTLSVEKKWLNGMIEGIKKKKVVFVLAECENRIVGSTEISKGDRDAYKHMGEFGIAVLEEFTGKGLGTKLTQIIINLAKKNLKTEIVKLSVFSNNKRAQGLYKKLGFKEIGRIKKGRKVKGKYADDVFMVKYL